MYHIKQLHFNGICPIETSCRGIVHGIRGLSHFIQDLIFSFRKGIEVARVYAHDPKDQEAVRRTMFED